MGSSFPRAEGRNHLHQSGSRSSQYGTENADGEGLERGGVREDSWEGSSSQPVLWAASLNTRSKLGDECERLPGTSPRQGEAAERCAHQIPSLVAWEALPLLGQDGGGNTASFVPKHKDPGQKCAGVGKGVRPTCSKVPAVSRMPPGLGSSKQVPTIPTFFFCFCSHQPGSGLLCLDSVQ